MVSLLKCAERLHLLNVNQERSSGLGVTREASCQALNRFPEQAHRYPRKDLRASRSSILGSRSLILDPRFLILDTRLSIHSRASILEPRVETVNLLLGGLLYVDKDTNITVVMTFLPVSSSLSSWSPSDSVLIFVIITSNVSARSSSSSSLAVCKLRNSHTV